METKLPVIALDGPAGSGKSTIAKLVAKRLGLRYIDTGAMYRAVTLMAIREKVNTKCEEDLIALVKRCSIEFKFYLDASVEERAKRRFKELKAKSIEQSLEEVKIDIMARDKRDKERAFGALKLVPDAIKVDTSDLSIEEVVNIIASRILSKGDVQI